MREEGLPATATYRPPRQHIAATAMMVAMLAAGAGVPAELPGLRLPAPKPRGYRVHLSKAERRGLSWAQQQALRVERVG